MEVKAKLRNYRVSARKARLLANEIRGKANAEERTDRDRAGIDVDNLVVEKITVDQGSSMWRIRPRAQGRASWIQRKTSHVSIVLTEH